MSATSPRNPILTSRHLPYDFWVNSTGHTDLVELPDGCWYMVALGESGSPVRVYETDADLLLAKNSYTGAYLGVYATANGQSVDEHADFDRVRYQVMPR